MKKNKEFPTFLYHKNPIETGAFDQCEQQICECCGEETIFIYVSTIYAVEDPEILCPWCIADGTASEKYEAAFTGEVAGTVSSTIEDIILHKTPGYIGNQEEIWLTHCKDACCFLGTVNWQDIQNLGIEEEIVKYYDTYEHYNDLDIPTLKKGLKSGHVSAYLFKCLHCNQYLLHNDAD